MVTAGGGQGSDVITFQAGGTSSDVQGGKGKDSITLVGTFTGSTIGGSNGFDTIRATGFTGTTSCWVAVKAATHYCWHRRHRNPRRRLSERHHTAFGAFGGGLVYGDKTPTSGGSGTGAEADGADLFSFTAAAVHPPHYGAGAMTPSAGHHGKLVVDGGKGADLVGSTLMSSMMSHPCWWLWS